MPIGIKIIYLYDELSLLTIPKILGRVILLNESITAGRHERPRFAPQS